MDKINNRLKKAMNAMRKHIIQLKAENFQLKNVIEHLPGDVYWKDKNGNWLGVNSTGSTTLKKMGFITDKSAVLGKTDFELFSKETAEQFRNHDLEVMTRKTEITKEEINVLPSGEEIIQLSTKRPLYNETGDVVGVVGNTVDITYLKHIEIDLKIAKERAETASRAKSEFIANISHDLRTPLTGVITMSDHLKDKLKGLDGEQEAIWLRESGQQLLEFCNNILDSITADNDTKQHTKDRTFDLRALIQAISNLQMPMIQSKGLDFSAQIDTAVPIYLIKDDVKLYRILLNLLGNAIKFTTQGHVGIEVKLVEKHSDEVTLEFSVTDTGIGIKPELQQYIFEHFFRINPSYKGLYKGNGLGLSIAQKYVQLLGGDRIDLESEEGLGCRFFFNLSFKIGEWQDAVPISIEQKQTLEPMHQSILPTQLQSSISTQALVLPEDAPFLLLIEDNKIALISLELLVKKAGCRFMSAENGESGVELAKIHPFDLIISDIGLPGISGIEAITTIRTWEREHNKRRVPVVALTGHAAQMAAPECLQAGIDKVLTKAVSLDDIKQLLEQFVLKNKPAKHNEPIINLSLDLPDTEEALFILNQYPYFDTKILEDYYGKNYYDIAKRALESMSGQLAQDKEDITSAFVAGDWQKIGKLAHRAKGGAAACGMLRMKYACQYLERYHKKGHSKWLEKLYYQLIKVLDETKIYLDDWLKKNLS